jgi:phosphatidylinositol alpha-1,6-mannosyltransferase
VARGLLALFPSLRPIGGVQASGRLAWEGITGRALGEPHGSDDSAPLLRHCSEPMGVGNSKCGVREWPPHDSRSTARFHAASKPGAILMAWRRRWPVDTVLIWHVGLLKLLPFFRLSGARLVLFLHGVEAWRRHDWLTRVLLRNVDLFLTNSDFTWQRFAGLNPDCATMTQQTLHLGIGSPLGAAPPRPVDPPAALVLGRLVRSEGYKGHRELIDAWPLVLKQMPDAELWIAGDGDLRPDLEWRVREHGLAHHVKFFGRVCEDQKQHLLARSRCLAMPSQAEGFGLVYLEAMRLGRPCLVSTLDAGREVVNPPEAGLAVDPRSREELARALPHLLTAGSEWDAWSEQARVRFEAHFTARHFRERLLETLAPSYQQDRTSAVLEVAI